MKKSLSTKVLATLMFLFAGMSAYAQYFSVSPSTSVTVTAEANTYADLVINLDNVSGAPLTLDWELVSNSFHADWDVTFCDYQACYFYLPPSRTMDPIPTDGQGFMRLTVQPGENIGTGTVVFDVWVSGDPGTKQTLTFTLDVLTEMQASALATEIDIYPNPAAEFLHVNNGTVHSGAAELLDAHGKTVMSLDLEANRVTTLDLSGLAGGVYFAKVRTAKGTFTRKLLVRH